jgi:hypothetical protein
MPEIKAITLTGTEVVLEHATIEAFRADLRGKLLTAADAGYDPARRLWNAMIDKRPALIVRCEGAADVGRRYVLLRRTRCASPCGVGGITWRGLPSVTVDS